MKQDRSPATRITSPPKPESPTDVRVCRRYILHTSWVPVEVISQFGRVKNLTQDCELIKKALSESNVVTIDHKRDMMRPKDQNARTVRSATHPPKGQGP